MRLLLIVGFFGLIACDYVVRLDMEETDGITCIAENVIEVELSLNLVKLLILSLARPRVNC